GNRGNGFYFRGGDTNAGSLMQVHAYTNQLYGFVLDDFLGNALYSPEASTNHQHGKSRKGAGTVLPISESNGNVTVTHSAGFSPQVGNSITITGTEHYDGTYFVSQVVDAGNFTFSKSGNIAAEHSGKIEYASNNEHFTAAGVSGGGYFSN